MILGAGNGFFLADKNDNFTHHIDLHVYIVPRDLWSDKYHNGRTKAVLASVSAGFIRVPVRTCLHNIRKSIAGQLRKETVPESYTFLRNAGRCLARVNPIQEVLLSAVDFTTVNSNSELLLLPDISPIGESSITKGEDKSFSSIDSNDDSVFERDIHDKEAENEDKRNKQELMKFQYNQIKKNNNSNTNKKNENDDDDNNGSNVTNDGKSRNKATKDTAVMSKLDGNSEAENVEVKSEFSGEENNLEDKIVHLEKRIRKKDGDIGGEQTQTDAISEELNAKRNEMTVNDDVKRSDDGLGIQDDNQTEQMETKQQVINHLKENEECSNEDPGSGTTWKERFLEEKNKTKRLKKDMNNYKKQIEDLYYRRIIQCSDEGNDNVMKPGTLETPALDEEKQKIKVLSLQAEIESLSVRYKDLKKRLVEETTKKKEVEEELKYYRLVERTKEVETSI